MSSILQTLFFVRYEPFGGDDRSIRNKTAYAPPLDIGSLIHELTLCLREIHQNLFVQAFPRSAPGLGRRYLLHGGNGTPTKRLNPVSSGRLEATFGSNRHPHCLPNLTSDPLLGGGTRPG